MIHWISCDLTCQKTLHKFRGTATGNGSLSTLLSPVSLKTFLPRCSITISMRVSNFLLCSKWKDSITTISMIINLFWNFSTSFFVSRWVNKSDIKSKGVPTLRICFYNKFNQNYNDFSLNIFSLTRSFYFFFFVKTSKNPKETFKVNVLMF